ncbi:MAG TPA: Gfo/Idh/MocA family oxidoreductase [Methylomirabilota bacterium]
MTTSSLRWGLLGTARINRALIPAIRAARRSRLAAVASRDPAVADAYARDWEIPVAHGSYEALLADPAIDAVYIPLPNHLHVEWTLRAIAAGKHVLCEKPIALTPQDVERLADAAAAAGVVVTEGFMYRHHPQTARVEALVTGGAIGEPRLVRGAFTFTLMREADVRLRPEWGGGSLWDVGCYPVSYARLLARAEPVSVTGLAEDGPTGIDLTFAGTLRFPDGLLASFDCGFRGPLRTELEVVGDEATLVVPHPFKPGQHEQLRIVRPEGARVVDVEGELLYVGEIRDMEDAALDGRPPTVSLTDSRGTVAAVAALYESARSRTHVTPS